MYKKKSVELLTINVFFSFRLVQLVVAFPTVCDLIGTSLAGM